ncbi:hypothetical protein BN1221_00143c [Brenneria goodwinii]|uniref:Uncharacterized protein n=1 Tax=Brenneria goodwinii TaxID=1109412 RepID=A0A0G4JP89_9GAMM|nr:hypothetical protein BN1221_00143c [Brenneria goodwinii]
MQCNFIKQNYFIIVVEAKTTVALLIYQGVTKAIPTGVLSSLRFP